MTYYDTQQQHNPQFNPQQWAAFNSQAGQPFGAWPGAPSMQAIGGYGLGQAAYGQQYSQYGGPAPLRAFWYNTRMGGPPPRLGPPQQPPRGRPQQPQPLPQE